MAKTKKIIIAEDEKSMANALKLKLSHSGMEATIASNGEEVLSLMKKGGFHLILLDLMMPKMDGFSVLEALKKGKSKVPIIVTSNLSQEEDVSRAKQLGAKDYLVKSDTPIAEIVEKIKTFLK